MDRTDVVVSTTRLILAPWRPDEAAAAVPIYGEPEVAKWLSPAMDAVQSEQTMRELIESWDEQDREDEPPVGHWSASRRSDGLVVGSVTLRRMPPVCEDLELAWQFVPAHWGHGYATEAAHAIATWAFQRSAHELFAVTRAGNDRAVRLAERLGMQWVGETDKYYDLRLQVYRVRPPELVTPAIIPDQR